MKDNKPESISETDSDNTTATSLGVESVDNVACMEEQSNSVESEADSPGEEVTEETASDEQSDLLQKLGAALSQADEFKNRYLRSVADLENYRRRMVREREDLRKYGAQVLLEELLPALDNMELGLNSVSQEDADNPVTQGFTMVLQQIKSILSNNGIKELAPTGEAFDPNYHDCVAHVPSDEFEENIITAVTRKGYLLYDRLIRPASVVVSSGPADKKEAS